MKKREEKTSRSQKRFGNKFTNKSSSLASENPNGINHQNKSALFARFEKNIKSQNNNKNASSENKLVVPGMDNEKFKNLCSIFNKKPEENSQEVKNNISTINKIDFDYLKNMIKNNNEEKENNTNYNKSSEIKQTPNLSIQERIKMLMKANDEIKTEKTIDDPILEELRKAGLEDNEENFEENDSLENLDISKEDEEKFDSENNNDNEDINNKDENKNENEDEKENEKEKERENESGSEKTKDYSENSNDTDEINNQLNKDKSQEKNSTEKKEIAKLIADDKIVEITN